MKRPVLQPADREYATWLAGVERSVILPVKWIILAVCFLHWLWTRNFEPPPTDVVALFVFFAGITLGEHYFFARDRILPSQVRLSVFTSFILDAFFVALLVVFDNRDKPPIQGVPLVSDYFLFFVLVVLRGFALFQTRWGNLGAFALASLLFFAAAGYQVENAGLLRVHPAIEKLALIWAAMLITQAFILLVHAQRAEERRIHERLLRSASLASLGELSAGVAHEINNPIGIIKTYAEYLEKSVSADNAMREDFATIRSEAQRCEEIVRRMLDFSNPQVQGLVSVDIGELVRDTAQVVFHQSDVRIDIAEAATLAPVQGDPVQLRQAFLNILMNARQIVSDAAPESGGRVEVALMRGAGPRPPVRVEVADNGPGIAEQDVEKVFEPFFTRRDKGTGLGLAITRRIVEAHNGTIRIAPRPGGGAVVTLELPIEGEEQP